MTDSPTLSPFHLAFCVHDLAAARRFYGNLLGCREGRSDATWVDFDFAGHQIVAHVRPEAAPCNVPIERRATQQVDGRAVPVPHHGLVLFDRQRWEGLADRLQRAGATFLIEPTIRFAGLTGEQATFFVLDPSENALEFKFLADPDRLFTPNEDASPTPQG